MALSKNKSRQSDEYFGPEDRLDMHMGKKLTCVKNNIERRKKRLNEEEP